MTSNLEDRDAPDPLSVSSPEVVRLLREAEDGRQHAAEDLLPLLYGELRRLARALAPRAASGDTLQPTALVHEAYMRLVGTEDPGWNSRGHFFGAAARAMRRIIIDYARHKKAAKRGGDRERLDIDEVPVAMPGSSTSLLALDEALRELERGSPRAARVVEHRYFAGLSVDETADSLNVSRSTVEREWRFARAFLRALLDDDGGIRS